MLERIKEMERRFEELGRKMSDRAILGNPQELKKIAKERAGLEDLVTTYQTTKRLKDEIEQNRELARDGDPELKEMARQELETLTARLKDMEARLQTLLLPKDPNDERNVLLEIRAGTGGDEAALFAADLFRMYSKYAESKGWRVEVMDSSPTGIGGTKEMIALISGEKAYSFLKFEAGIHRVQRVPKTEQQGRIHTSAVTVAVLPEAEDVDITVSEADLQTDVFRASGPGGQGVNTTDSAVRITHKPSGLVVVCRDERSQMKNKAKAMKILKSRLLEIEQGRQDEAMAQSRKAMVGSGDRSEKIRTYNFPQNRLTDHRIGLTLHQLDRVMDGKLDEIIGALQTHAQTEALKSA